MRSPEEQAERAARKYPGEVIETSPRSDKNIVVRKRVKVDLSDEEVTVEDLQEAAPEEAADGEEE